MDATEQTGGLMGWLGTRKWHQPHVSASASHLSGNIRSYRIYAYVAFFLTGVIESSLTPPGSLAELAARLGVLTRLMKDTVGEKGHLSITAIHQQLYEEPTPNHHTTPQLSTSAIRSACGAHVSAQQSAPTLTANRSLRLRHPSKTGWAAIAFRNATIYEVRSTDRDTPGFQCDK